MIRVLIILFFLFSVGLVIQDNFFKPNPVAVTPTPAPTLAPKTQLDADKLWSLIQEWRKSQGFKPYIVDQRLCNLAETRLKEVKTDYSHNGFWKHSEEYLIYFEELAENLSKETQDEEGILNNGWLMSPKHRKTLDYPYAYSCLKTQDFFVVHLFGNF